MSLILEDGTCVAGADTWISLDDANAHFAAYGGFWGSQDATDAAKEAALRRAALWLSTSIRWNGKKVCAGSMLAWPRSGTRDCEGSDIPTDVIPHQVILAQLAAASAELQSPGILTPSITPGQQVAREKVDVIEVQYMTPLQQGFTPKTYDPLVQLRPVLTQVNDLLRCLATVGKAGPWPFVA